MSNGGSGKNRIFGKTFFMALEIMKKVVEEDDDDQGQEPIVKPGYGEMGIKLRKNYMNEQVAMASAGGINRKVVLPNKKIIMKKVVKKEM
jgi:hypothetical protein